MRTYIEMWSFLVLLRAPSANTGRTIPHTSTWGSILSVLVGGGGGGGAWVEGFQAIETFTGTAGFFAYPQATLSFKLTKYQNSAIV
jgi:hypothetical protein